MTIHRRYICLASAGFATTEGITHGLGKSKEPAPIEDPAAPGRTRLSILNENESVLFPCPLLPARCLLTAKGNDQILWGLASHQLIRTPDILFR